jgi:Mg/Co/Ni transporter MgtE
MSDEQITLTDSIVRNRSLVLPEPSNIPEAPVGYIPSPLSDTKGLRRIAGKLDAEALQALDQCIERGKELKIELGDGVSSLEQLTALKEKKKRLLVIKARLASLKQFIEEADDITNHDLATALSDLGDEVEHRLKKKPQLANNYDLLLKYTNAHGELIAEGRVRAQEKKQVEQTTKEK